MSAQVIMQHESFAPPASPREELFRLVAYAVIAIVGVIAGFYLGRSYPVRPPAAVPAHVAPPVPHPRSLGRVSPDPW
jgi:hypothetical protein